MSTKETGISWTDFTWNPTRGCNLASPGCLNCYAMKLAWRFAGLGMPYAGLVRMGKRGPQWTGDTRFVLRALAEPLGWHGQPVVFIDSMSDLFLHDFTDVQIAAVFGVVAVTPAIRYMLLTKRAERMRSWFERIAHPAPLAGEEVLPKSAPGGEQLKLGAAEPAAPIRWSRETIALRCALMAARLLRDGGMAKEAGRIMEAAIGAQEAGPMPWPLTNLAVGVSVENQEWANRRVPELARVPAAMRFVSQEPTLELVVYGVDEDATANRLGLFTCPKCRGSGENHTGSMDVSGYPQGTSCRHCAGGGSAIDLVIFGGESGAGARPCAIEALQAGVAECRRAGVAPYVKQVGRIPTAGLTQLRLRASQKGDDPAEWPADLRVQEMPDGWRTLGAGGP